jgi:hypothetical protein
VWVQSHLQDRCTGGSHLHYIIPIKKLFLLFVAGLTACSQHNNAVVSSNDLNWIDLTHPYDRTTYIGPITSRDLNMLKKLKE